jgi:hypothetical protein
VLAFAGDAPRRCSALVGESEVPSRALVRELPAELMGQTTNASRASRLAAGRDPAMCCIVSILQQARVYGQAIGIQYTI